MISSPLERKEVLAKLHFAGHHVSQESLNAVWTTLSTLENSAQMQTLNLIIYKLDELTIMQGKRADDTLVKQCLISLTYKAGNMSYLDIINQKFRKSVVYISPYEYCTKDMFCMKPAPHLFKFRPESKTKSYFDRFDKLRGSSRDLLEGAGRFIGVLYDKRDLKTMERMLYLENGSNVMNIDVTEAKINSFLVSGCTYVAVGPIVGKSLIMSVTELLLPMPVATKDPLPKLKFEEACKQLASMETEDSLYQLQDSLSRKNLSPFGIELDESKSEAPVLIFGNVTLNSSALQSLQEIVKTIDKVACLVLLLSDQKHSVFDLGAINAKIYLVPHLYSSGPMRIPKIPLSKQPFRNCQVVTNPARFSINSKNVCFTNYPIIEPLHRLNLSYKYPFTEETMLSVIGDFIFRQSNLGIGHEYFWEQSPYMDVYADNIVIITDKLCRQGHKTLQCGGAIVSTGHFSRDGQFIVYFPKHKDPVRLSAYQPN